MTREGFESLPYEEQRWSILKSYVRDVEAWARKSMRPEERKRVRELFHKESLTYDDLQEMIGIHQRVLPHWWNNGVQIQGV
jgi:hypothetical protein